MQTTKLHTKAKKIKDMANLRYFSQFVEETQETIIESYNADSIKNFYSTYGTYYKSQSPNGEIQEHQGKPYGDPADLAKGLKAHFEEKFAGQFTEDDDNDFFFSTDEAKEYFELLLSFDLDNEGEIVEEGKMVWVINEEIEEVEIQETGYSTHCEGFTEWDGNNWKLIELVSTFGETPYSEVTDEYDWDSLTHIQSGDHNKPISYDLYVMKDLENEGEYFLVKEYVTRYQGDSNHYEISYDEAAIVENFSDEEIATYFPEIAAKGENLKVAYRETNQGTDYDKYLIFSKDNAKFIKETNPNETRGTDYYELPDGTKLKYHWTRWQGEKSEWTY